LHVMSSYAVLTTCSILH